MRRKQKSKNCPAQADSEISKLKVETENSLPQRHSKMSNGRLSGKNGSHSNGLQKLHFGSSGNTERPENAGMENQKRKQSRSTGL